ncbi:hypothetical protein [Actinomadura luteofluorescens]
MSGVWTAVATGISGVPRRRRRLASRLGEGSQNRTGVVVPVASARSA